MPGALADKIAVKHNAGGPVSAQNEIKQCKCGRGPEKYRKDGVSMGLCTECLKERMQGNRTAKPANTPPMRIYKIKGL